MSAVTALADHRRAVSDERWLDKVELRQALAELGFRVGTRKLHDLAVKDGMPSEFQFRTRMFLLSEVLPWLEAEGHIRRRNR